MTGWNEYGHAVMTGLPIDRYLGQGDLQDAENCCYSPASVLAEMGVDENNGPAEQQFRDGYITLLDGTWLSRGGTLNCVWAVTRLPGEVSAVSTPTEPHGIVFCDNDATPHSRTDECVNPWPALQEAPTMPADQPAQGSTADYCSRWPGEPHAISTHMRNGIAVRRCDSCGWIDFDDLEAQVTALAAGEPFGTNIGYELAGLVHRYFHVDLGDNCDPLPEAIGVVQEAIADHGTDGGRGRAAYDCGLAEGLMHAVEHISRLLGHEVVLDISREAAEGMLASALDTAREAGRRQAVEAVRAQANLPDLVHFDRPSDFRKGVLSCLAALEALEGKPDA